MKQACENCGRSQKDRPAIFKNERWCSDLCKKALENKESEEDAEWTDQDEFGEIDTTYPPGRCPSTFTDDFDEVHARCVVAHDVQHDLHHNADKSIQWRDHGHGIKERLRRIADRPQA